MIPAPTLSTERLILRAPADKDFAGFAALHAAPHARWLWAPADCDAAWRAFLAMAGNWPVSGCGWWVVADRNGDVFLGYVGFSREAPGAEPELSWAVAAEAEGRGIAFEAVQAARAWGRGQGILSPVSHIDARNARSIRLAERLGAWLESRTVFARDAVALQYRHPAEGAI